MDEPILLKETYPVARKEHRCGICGGIIEKGEKYVSQHCKMDYVYTFKMHTHCNIASSMVYQKIESGDPDEIIEQMAIELEDKGIEVPRKSDEIVKQYLNVFKNV